MFRHEFMLEYVVRGFLLFDLLLYQLLATTSGIGAGLESDLSGRNAQTLFAFNKPNTCLTITKIFSFAMLSCFMTARELSCQRK